MTRDLDIVVSLNEEDVSSLVAALSPDFYIDADSVRSTVVSQRLFNLMHFATSIKVDLIVRKGSEYRQVEFARRRPVELGGVKTWIVSREDLIQSKLVWAKDSGSELQRRDVRTLLDDSMDRAYLERCAARPGCGRGSCGDRAMNDTSPEFEAMVNERYRRMTPDERVRIAASMYDAARAIVLSSLPRELSRRERRLAFARRFYEGGVARSGFDRLCRVGWIGRCAMMKSLTAQLRRCSRL
jgi:hypothetical protein